MKNMIPPRKISRTPKSKKDLQKREADTKVEQELTSAVETETSTITAPSSEARSQKQSAAATERAETYKNAKERIIEIAKELSPEDIAALAAQKGLTIKEEIKFVRHTFQVSEVHLEKFQEYSSVLGKKKKNIVYEALNDFFSKHEEEFLKIKEVKNKVDV